MTGVTFFDACSVPMMRIKRIPSEEEESSVGVARTGAGSEGSVESNSGAGFLECDSKNSDMGEYNSSDTTVNGPCAKGHR